MLFRTDAGVIMCSFHLLALQLLSREVFSTKSWKSEIVKKNEKRKKENNLHQHCLSHWLTR